MIVNEYMFFGNYDIYDNILKYIDFFNNDIFF